MKGKSTMTIYEKNLEALQEQNPDVFALLQSPISTDHIEVVEAASGAKRLLVRTESGETVAIHNAEDPLGSAQRAADNIDIDQGGVFALLGMGLGYLPLALGRQLVVNSSLVVFEADPAIFLTAMHHVDLTPLLKSPRVRFLVGPDVGISGVCFHLLVRNGGEYVRAIRYEPAMRLNPTLYKEKLEKELAQYTHAATMNIATMNRFGALFSRSTLEAVPHIISAYGLTQLKGRFPGVPAILVAAGPSLQKNVHYLREARGRAIIICGDTVLGYLLARDIKPDFVVSVDSQEMTFSKYHGVDIPEDVGLVFHPGCYEKIFKQFPGPKFASATKMPAYHWLRHCWAEKGSVDGENQCQMHMGFVFAEWLGCNPIVIVGQDLCFTDERMHVKGGSYLTKQSEAEHVESGTQTINIFGEQVRTSPAFLSYRSTFERKVKYFPGISINATEGGLPIEGAENLRLEDVIHEYCEGVTVNVTEVLKNCQDEVSSTLWVVLLEEIQLRIRDFHRLERVSRHLCRLLEEMALERKKSQDISEHLAKLSAKAERLTQLVPRYHKALGLLQIFNYNLELYMLREDTDAVDQVEDPLEKLDKQIERGLRYYGDLLRIVPIVGEDIIRLEQRLSIFRNLQTTQGPDFPGVRERREAEGYHALEIFDRAGKAIAPCLQGSISTVHDFQFAIHNFLSLNQVSSAYTLSQEAKKQFPNNQQIIAACEQAEIVWDKWQEKKREANKESPMLMSFIAKGDFYYRLKNFTKAIEHYRAATDSAKEDKGEAWYRLAKASQESGDEDQRVEALEKALLVIPSDPRIYYDLGVMALEGHQAESAERFFMKGVEVSLNDPEYCEASGAVLAAAGYPSQAIPFYEKALSQLPGNPELLTELSRAYQTIFEEVPSV